MQRQHDATATAYMPAITALRADLADMERRTADTRLLLDQLCAYAGISGEPAEAAVPSRAVVIKREIEQAQDAGKGADGSGGRGKKKTQGQPSTEIGKTRDKAAAPVRPDLTAAVVEWQQILTSRAEAIAQAEGAARDKDAAKLKAAVAARARLELRAGEILTVIDGRVRPLPGGTDRNARERWKLLAQVSVPEFENALRRWQHRALAAIGVRPEKPAPAKAKPSTRPHQAMRISAWREEPDGSRSRTVTAVDGAGASRVP